MEKIIILTNNKGELFFNKKVTIINGISSTIGLSIARTLLENGMYIAGTYNKGKERVNNLIKKYGEQKIVGFQINFLSANYQKMIKYIVEKTKEHYGTINNLINVAGIWLVKPFLYEDKEEIENLWRINYWTPYKFIKTVLPYMINKKGCSIINIASTAGEKGTGQAASYSASKAALINLTESLAEEFAVHGIRINAISPGYTNTPALDKYFDNALKELIMKHIPMARLCKPVDVANATLAILMNDYIEGTNIILHGGKL